MVVGSHEGIVIHRTFLSHKCFIHAHVPREARLDPPKLEAAPDEAMKHGCELFTLCFEGKDEARHMKRTVKLGDALSFQIPEEAVKAAKDYSFSSTITTQMVVPCSWKVTVYRLWDTSQVLYTRRLWGMESRGQAKTAMTRSIKETRSHGKRSLKLDKALQVALFLQGLVPVEKLRKGSGVYDVAGGSGHVSYVLGQMGVPSTVVDPRDTVACLPRRDRKRLSRLNLSGSSCQAVRPLRAYFGSDSNVDKEFSGGSDIIGVVASTPSRWEEEDEKLRKCSAIVALHPDEATEYVIDFALEHNKPFVVVPCCAFYRLGNCSSSGSGLESGRREGESYVQFLCRKSSGIRLAELGFEGASTVLYCIP